MITADCDDHNSCTTDTCDSTTNACQHVATGQCAPDAGTGVDLGGGGCSCRAGGGASSSATWILAFLVVVVLVRRRRRGVVTAAVVLIGVMALHARADGFDADMYQAVTSSSGYLTQESASVLPARELDLASSFDFARDPLVARDPVTGATLMDGNVVSNRLGLQLTGGYGVTRTLEVGLGGAARARAER